MVRFAFFKLPSPIHANTLANGDEYLLPSNKSGTLYDQVLQLNKKSRNRNLALADAEGCLIDRILVTKSITIATERSHLVG